jgi:hypothetical protein
VVAGVLEVEREQLLDRRLVFDTRMLADMRAGLMAVLLDCMSLR